MSCSCLCLRIKILTGGEYDFDREIERCLKQHIFAYIGSFTFPKDYGYCNSNSNLSNTTKLILLESLLPEVTVAANIQVVFFVF